MFGVFTFCQRELSAASMRMRFNSANWRLVAIVLIVAGVCLAGTQRAQAQGRCGAGVDLVVQALEKIRADNSADELMDADQLLKRAVELCDELGDAWCYRSLVERKLVVAYVATHGSSRDLDTVGVNYIITHDTIIGANIDPDSVYATALPMVEGANAIATRVKAGRAAIFLDTCYSGNAAVQDNKLMAPGVKNAAPSRQLQHGFFTYYLVQALQQAGGSAPLSKIFDYKQQHVSQTVATEFKQYNLQQNPVMSRSEDSTDFALAASAGAAAGGEL